MTKQQKINAAIAYLFLGPLFVLAKKTNPIYQDPYIAFHATRSTRHQGILLIFWLAYAVLIGSFVREALPFGDWIDYAISVLLYGGGIGYLVFSAYRAFVGDESTIAQMQSPTVGLRHIMGMRPFHMPGLTEDQKILFVLATLPYVGLLVDKNARYPIVRLGILMQICCVLVFSGLILLTPQAWTIFIIYLCFVAFIVIHLFFWNTLYVPKVFISIEGEVVVFVFVRAVLRYLSLLLLPLIGKAYYSFATALKATADAQKDVLRQSIQPIHPIVLVLLQLPGIGCLFRFTLRRKYMPSLLYSDQAAMVSTLYILNGYLFGWTNGFFAYLLFASFALVAFYIKGQQLLFPLIQECVIFTQGLIRWIVRWFSFLHTKKQTHHSVRMQVIPKQSSSEE